MRHLTIVLLVLALSTCLSVKGQVSFWDLATKKALRPVSGWAEAEIRPAYIFPTHDFFKGENNRQTPIRSSFSAHAKIGFSLSDSLIMSIYPDTRQGIGLSFNTFYQPQLIGNPWAVYIYQASPVLTFSDQFSLDYEWNFGLSAGWNPYDPVENESNHIIGTRINAYLDVSFGLKWQATPRIGLIAGISFSHFSNGNTGIPNCGLNTMAFNLGVLYRITGSADFATCPPKPAFDRHFSYDLTLFGSFRRKGVDTGNNTFAISPERYPVFGLNFNPMYNFSYRFRAGVSLDGVLDTSAGIVQENVISDLFGNHSEPGFIRPCAAQQLSLGMSVRGEYVMPFFSINAGIGYNFIGNRDQRGLYQILALKIDITRNVFVHLGYNLHNFHDPNYLMLGMGFRFGNRFPELF